MSCISSNFSSFFLNSLNDPSEFSKYLSNGELRFSSFEDFQVYNNSSPQQYQQQQQPQPHYHMNGTDVATDDNNSNLENTQPQPGQHYAGGSYQQQQQHPQQAHASMHAPHGVGNSSTHPLMHLQQHQQRWTPHAPANGPHHGGAATTGSTGHQQQQQHFDGSFEFMKYLRHSNEYNETNAHDPNQRLSSHPHHHHQPHNGNASSGAVGGPGPTAIGTKPEPSLNANNSSLIDLDTTPHKVSRSSRKTPANSSNSNSSNSNSTSNHHPPTPMAVDVYDHDSKHMLYDMHHMNSAHSSNSNESSMELSSLTYPNSHLNASNSNTSSEGGGNTQGHSDFSMLGVGGAGAGSSTTSSSSGNPDAAAASPAAPKPLATFTIVENFEAHPSHKVEEGIFQHMNKLPTKKKENLKQLGVRFTGQMTLNDKSIIVENFIKFCQEYDIQDHRPFLSLNQSGLNKPDQIKFARYLGQGLPTFTLFCIYSNFKNLFCTKRTENYTKDGYNLPYILEKTKSFLANTAADLKNILNQQSNDSMDFLVAPASTTGTTSATIAPTSGSVTTLSLNLNNNNGHTNGPLNVLQPPPLIPAQSQQQQQQHPTTSTLMDFNQNSNQAMLPPTAINGPQPAPTRPLENLMIFDNFDVHETHRIEDGICTQLSRLPPKKQELLKQFGIQTNQTVTYYEKYILIENFNRFCNEYKVADHRPFLDLSESGLPKSEQLKFIRYLGQGLPNLTLNKIYLVFKDILGLSRIEKMAIEGYNLDAILKKKKRNLYNRMTAAAVHKECNPDANTPALPTTATATIAKPSSVPVVAANIMPAPALTPVYQQESYKT
ncbi:G-box-binding factor isoform X3 [Musca domestica]|uniref:G-box-binding factor isoform X3 n=1 Tax=Musca domestica TaxID=7370 RepID=A0ABM3VPY2_MUSDO|nr:G-box-binding factor isoform X3 [Musca domestica]